MSLLHMLILLASFWFGADVSCLLARIVFPAYGSAIAVISTLVGGVLGVLLLPRSATRLVTRLFPDPRFLRARYIAVIVALLLLALLGVLNLKVQWWSAQTDET